MRFVVEHRRVLASVYRLQHLFGHRNDHHTARQGTHSLPARHHQANTRALPCRAVTLEQRRNVEDLTRQRFEFVGDEVLGAIHDHFSIDTECR